MKKNPAPESGIFTTRSVLSVTLCLTGVMFAMFSLAADPAKPSASDSASQTPEAAQQTLAQLESERGTQMITQVSRSTGRFAFVRAPGGNVLAATRDASASPEARAASFLAEYGGLVGLTQAERDSVRTGAKPEAGSDLQVVKTDTDQLGMSHVRLDQHYKGLKVFGAQLVVHMNGDGITAVNGEFVPDIAVSTIPAVSKDAAAETAVAILRKGGGGEDLKINKIDLAIYPHGLFQDQPVVSRLAYGVEVEGAKKHEVVWVDAENGAVLNRISRRHHALYREVWSPEYRPLPSPAPQPFLQRKEGDPPHPTPFVNNLYDFAGDTYNLYASAFGRDSYDGAGHKMISVYLINQQCPNAYWNSESTNYCPIFDADDVVSHEWGHAYTEHTHGLIYSFQSGALNESYSDIFGETMDLLNMRDGSGGTNNSQPYPAGQRWLVGEDLGAELQELLLRDMYDPDRLGDPGKVSSENYFCGSDDGGGVHTNSGVPNHAYALIVDGTQFKPADPAIGQAAGTYNGQTITGIGFTKAAAIYWRAESVYQTPSSNFPIHDQAIQTSCNDLIGADLRNLSTTSPTGVVSSDRITAADCQQVAKAMLAVEMSAPPPCPFAPLLSPAPAPICPGANTNVIFEEDWEGANADAGWTRTSNGFGTGTQDWEDKTRPLRDFKLTTTIPPGHNGGQVIFADDPRVGEPGGGTCAPGGDYSGEYTISSPAIPIPAGRNNVHVSFDHYVATEGTVDGGQLEISTDNGANYILIPNDKFVFNGYNGHFDPPPPVGVHTGPNATEEAWTGTNGGTVTGSWGKSVVDISEYATPGSTIRIRFHWTQDGCNGVEGWWIDNIRVYDCVDLPAPTLSTGSDYQNPDPDGAYTLNWTRPPGAVGPDLLQESQTSCDPLFADNAEGTLATNWVATREQFAATWQQGTKPRHAPNNAFWASPTPGGEVTFGTSTLTMRNPITIPFVGTTTLNFREWYFNEEDDRAFVDITTDNGTTWTTIHTVARDMGGLPETGANAYANEALMPRQLDLTPYAGQQVKVRFRMVHGGQEYFLFVTYGWYVDDIVVQNDNWATLAETNATSLLVSGRGAGKHCYRVNTNYTIGNETFDSPFSNVVTTIVAEGVTPFLTGIVSRKTHGATPFDIPLPRPIAGPAGIECRNQGNNSHQVVFFFDQPAAVTSASVTPGPGGTAEVANMSGNTTNTVTLTLTNVSNAQTLQVNLNGVSDGMTTQNFSIPMSVLNGDTTANRAVTSSDIGQVKSQSGQPLSGANFRLDVNANGDINATDISQVKANSGTSLPQ